MDKWIFKNKMTAMLALGVLLMGATTIGVAITGDYCVGMRCDALENLVENPTPYKTATGLGNTDTGMNVTRMTVGSSGVNSRWLINNKAYWQVQSSNQGACWEPARENPYGPLATGQCMGGVKFAGDATGYSVRIENDNGDILTETPLALSNHYYDPTTSSNQPGYTDAWTSGVVCHPDSFERKLKICRTASGAGATIAMGELFYGKYNVKLATATSAFKNWTPTFTGLGTPVINLARWRQQGEMLEGEIRVTAGTTTSAPITFTLPNSLQSDYSFSQRVGEGSNTSTAHPDIGIIWDSSSSKNLLSFSNITAGTSGSIVFTGTTFPSSTVFYFKFKVKIAGWSEGAQLADQYGGNPINFRGDRNAASITTTAGGTSVIPYNVNVKDSVGAWNGTQYVVRSSGDYVISPSFRTQDGVVLDQFMRVRVTRSGSPTVYNLNNTGSGVQWVWLNGTIQLPLIVGDVVEVLHVNSNASGSVIIQSGQGSLSIYKISNPNYAIPMLPDIVKIRANKTSAQNLNANSSQNIIGWNESTDSHDFFDPSTGIFTPTRGNWWCVGGFTISTNTDIGGTPTLSANLAGFTSFNSYFPTGSTTWKTFGAMYLGFPVNQGAVVRPQVTLNTTGGPYNIFSSGTNNLSLTCYPR